MALDLHKSDSQAAGVAEQPEDHAAD
jgi:hypothetical protein